MNELTGAVVRLQRYLVNGLFRLGDQWGPIHKYSDFPCLTDHCERIFIDACVVSMVLHGAYSYHGFACQVSRIIFFSVTEYTTRRAFYRIVGFMGGGKPFHKTRKTATLRGGIQQPTSWRLLTIELPERPFPSVQVGLIASSFFADLTAI